MTGLSERLKACIAIEQAAAEIYHGFVALFPEAADFWRELALEEENHVHILIAARGYLAGGRLPEYAVPPYPLIEGTLDLAHAIRERIKKGDITLKEALDQALYLETSVTESYFREIMTVETKSEALSNLQKLVTDTKSHAESIKEFMKGMGF
jgi:rubrerythrin